MGCSPAKAFSLCGVYVGITDSGDTQKRADNEIQPKGSDGCSGAFAKPCASFMKRTGYRAIVLRGTPPLRWVYNADPKET